MIRQILIAKTVKGDDVVLTKAADVEGINEIRETLKKAATDRCLEVEADGKKQECAYVELWNRDTGVSRVIKLKRKSQLKPKKAKVEKPKDEPETEAKEEKPAKKRSAKKG